MSTSGYKNLPRMNKHIRETLLRKPVSKDYKDQMDYHIKKWQVIGSPDYPCSETDLHPYVESMLQRGITEKGTIRQMLSIMAAGNREDALSKLDIPSLVIHGDRDELVNLFELIELIELFELIGTLQTANGLSKYVVNMWLICG